jgi:hypothetical protein
MNTQSQTPKSHQLQESTAGEEDPGAGLDAQPSAIKPDSVAPSAQDDDPYEETYENVLPGTNHNDTDGPKPYEGGNIARTMMQFAQTDAERGSPGLTPEEMRAMKR